MSLDRYPDITLNLTQGDNEESGQNITGEHRLWIIEKFLAQNSKFEMETKTHKAPWVIQA